MYLIIRYLSLRYLICIILLHVGGLFYIEHLPGVPSHKMFRSTLWDLPFVVYMYVIPLISKIV